MALGGETSGERDLGVLPRLMRMSPIGEREPRATAAGVFTVCLGEAGVDGQWRIACAGRIMHVVRSESCLLQPMAGDTVQLLVPDHGARAWIVSVLMSASPEELTIDAGQKALRVKGREVTISSETTLAVKADRISQKAVSIDESVARKTTMCSGAQIVQSGSMMIDADRHLSLRSKLATVTAESLLKIDGAQIHMG